VNPVKWIEIKPGKLRCLSEFHGINVSWGKSLGTKSNTPIRKNEGPGRMNIPIF